MNTPGFTESGIDFEQLVHCYITSNYNIEITDPTKIKLAKDLMAHVINASYGYNDSFSSSLHGRFQMIFNSTLEELVLEKAGFTKRSNAIWSLDSKYETGTDFLADNGAKIEAKVYKAKSSMLKAAEAGTLDYKVFHGADYVICYLIDGEVEILAEEPFRKVKHWFWLKKINDEYIEYNDSELLQLTEECLPKTIPICRCIFYEDNITISENTFCT